MSNAVKAAKEVYNASNTAAQNAWSRFVKCTQAAINGEDPDNCSLTDTASEITETNYEAFKNLLKLAMTEAGETAENAEKWIESNGKDVWHKAQGLRKSKAAQTAAAKIAKVLHGIKVGLISLLASFMVFAFGYRKVENIRHGDALSGLEANEARWEASEQFQRQMEQFNSFSTAMSAPDVDVPRTADPTVTMQAAEPEVAMMPPQVQAIAIQPVEITITTEFEKGDFGHTPETKTITTTVGQLYLRGDRETRTEIERRAADPETKPYVYAFQEKNSCTQTHCMEGHGGMKTDGKWDGRNGPGGLHAEQH